VGPIARCVRDAALCLDVIAGPTADDPKTEAAAGHLPDGGYTALLRSGALVRKRLGLYGPGWRDQPISADAAALYETACATLERCGATLVADPFAGSGFAALRASVSEEAGFDARGMESIPNDIERYLERLGPDRAIRDFAAFAEATRGDDPFAPGATLGFMHLMPGFAEGLADPAATPDMSSFLEARRAYLEIFDRVMATHRLDALVFPQMRAELPPLFSGLPIEETTVSEINIAGLPGVTVPAGRYASGAPFGLIFVGPLWSEAGLLTYAYDFERAVSGNPTASATSATHAAAPSERKPAE
jgi:aspartyl-tRNA(Asn)/glutamyl-tRNA(Gln) amidotransferase subunit A